MVSRKLFLVRILLLFSLYCRGVNNTPLQDSIVKLNNTGVNFFYAGDYEKAEAFFIQSLKIKREVYDSNHGKIANEYNNLGVININKWQYDIALEYLNKAKDIYNLNPRDKISLAIVYSNIGNVYQNKGDYLHAIEYYNKSLEFLEGGMSEVAVQRRSEVITNYAKLEIERRNFSSSISLVLNGIVEYTKTENRNDVILHDMLITASRAYRLSNKPDSSLYYIQKSIELFKNVDVNFVYIKAESFLLLSEYYLKQKRFTEALNSIISVHELFKNSSIDSVFYFDIVKLYANYYELTGDFKNSINYYEQANRLLLNKNVGQTNDLYASNIKAIALLKDKANCLINWYNSDKNKTHLRHALTELKTVAQLIDKSRKGYLTIESKLLLAENEDAIYTMGLNSAYTLYSLTQNRQYIDDAFYFIEKGKSSVLLGALNEEKAKSFAGIPDSLLQKEQEQKRNLAFYKEKLYEENLKNKPDSLKLKTWKNYLFKYSQENEQLTDYLEQRYPEYYKFKYKSDLLSIDNIQASLNRHTSLVEYTIADSLLYTLVINKNEATLYRTPLNRELLASINVFLNQFRNFDFNSQGNHSFRKYEKKAYNIYTSLMGFIDPDLLKNELIIVPDGILSYIPFEALVYSLNTGSPSSYGSLNYLLYKHTTYYAYSASLFVETRNSRKLSLWNKVLAMAPYYNYSTNNVKITQLTYRSNLKPLPQAINEVKMVAELTHGTYITGEKATEEYFAKNAAAYDILHLAMHALINDDNPLYSKLVFYNNTYQNDEGLLNTNEIFSLKLNAQMTVLSACSSGEGEFKKGEGVMSLSRGFFYAGCPSLVMTLWKIEDEKGLTLMKSFYKYLIRGYSKSEALRKAKIDYIHSSLEQNKHPFFWSSYIVIGNSSSIYISKWIFIVAGIIMLAVIAFLKKKYGPKKKLPEPTLF